MTCLVYSVVGVCDPGGKMSVQRELGLNVVNIIYIYSFGTTSQASLGYDLFMSLFDT